ncbi:hypothetical protein [Zhihengliuella sp. ISTPL4]|uniref:hypothetical protein n=1 Tax=Zhihengliuella sp. ISTPL4 TaxID=2058657 RepID=UPI000C7C72DB|nr:hypothetical protein [Zhihengliuella sp. ISTPL4]
MKLVSYAGQQLLTSDDVAETLLTLAAAIASEGESEAVEIPIVLDGEKDWADLLVGVGNDVLVSPHHSGDPEPDFSTEVDELRAHRHFPKTSDDSSARGDIDIPALSDFDMGHGL